MIDLTVLDEKVDDDGLEQQFSAITLDEPTAVFSYGNYDSCKYTVYSSQWCHASALRLP